MPKYSDSIVAHLDGGFGNQLFIFAAALSQSRRLGCPLIIDASEYVRKTQIRSYELQFLEDLADEVVLSPTMARKLRLKRSSSLKSLSKYSFEETNPVVFDSSINSVLPGTTLRGYFQSPLYFELVSEELFQRFESAKNSYSLKDAGNDQVHIHYRRGDYLLAQNAQFHGMIGPNYVSRSLSLLSKLGFTPKVTIFSDEPSLAESDLTPVVSSAKYEQGVGESSLYSMLRLSNANALIMSNSSFSWWAGWLMSMRQSSVVIAPRPWFRDDSAASDLLLPEWITLAAR